MNIKKYQCNPEGEAIQITEENAEDVAKWCEGRVDTCGNETIVCFKTGVDRYVGSAYIGDYLIKVGDLFETYSEPYFSARWKPVQEIDVGDIVCDESSDALPMVVACVKDGYAYEWLTPHRNLRLENCTIINKADDHQREVLLHLLTIKDGPYADYARERLGNRDH